MMETMEDPLLNKTTTTKRTRSFGTSRRQQQQQRPLGCWMGGLVVLILCLFVTICSWVLSTTAVLSSGSVRRMQQAVTAATVPQADPSSSMTTRIHHRRPSTTSAGSAKDVSTKAEKGNARTRDRDNNGGSNHDVTRHDGDNDIIMAATQTSPPAVDSPSIDDESDAESSASSLLDILSSKRQAFWKDAILQEQVKANVDCHGKEELLSILYAAGIMDGRKNNRNPAQTTDKSAKYQQWLLDACPKLSPWSDVTEMYGSQPVVVGMETCDRYRKTLLQSADNNQTKNTDDAPISPLIRVAGLYNTGTNSLQQSLMRNLPKSINPLVNNNVLLQQVPHGKHMPVKYKYQNLHPAYHRAPYKNIHRGHVLPIVLVRDPYRWMQTTCKRRYDAEWERDGDHCPNLVRAAWRDEPEPNTTTRTYTVNLKYHAGRHNSLRDEYPSLADMWSTWIRDYLEFTNGTDIIEPRLVIRFEDLLFHAEYVFSKILECVGVTPESWAMPTTEPSPGKSFEYIVQKSKVQGDSLDFMGALMKYGRNDEHDRDGGSRIKGMTRQDLIYAAAGRVDGDYSFDHHVASKSSPPRGLDPKLMELFRYRHPVTNAIEGQSKSIL